MGIPYRDFWGMTLKHLEIHQEVYSENMEAQELIRDQQAWLNGQYVMMAIGAALDKKNRYPNEPMLMKKHSETDEPQDNTQTIKTMFEVWGINYNISKGHGGMREIKNLNELSPNKPGGE